MKVYVGVDVQIHVFLTSALVGSEWSVSRFGFLPPEKMLQVPVGQETGWVPVPVWTTWGRENS
jgi:hypothetical protein